MDGRNGEFGGRLFSGTTTGTRCIDLDYQLGDLAFDFEQLIMRRTVCGDYGIGRKIKFASLQEFLQKRLGIFAQGLGIDMEQYGLILARYHHLRCIEAAVQEDGAQDSFEGVRQYGRTPETAAFELTFA